MKQILTFISILRMLEIGLQGTMKEILTWFFTLWWLKTWLHDHYERDFDTIFYIMVPQN